MTKRRTVVLFLISALGLVGSGCGGDDDGGMTDAGTGDGAAGDAFVPEVDGGLDAGPSDAGPTGCTVDCEIEQLALGVDFSCARRRSGEILCWGANHRGQLGDGRERHGTMDCSYAEETDPVDCTGPVTGLVRDAAHLTARGAYSACAIDASGETWCWGWEGVSRPGSDALEKRFTPVRFGVADATDASDGWTTTCAVAGGEVFCTSTNGSGQAGTGNTVEIRTPTVVPGLSGIVDIEVGVFGRFACARSTDQTWCWGANDSGQFGDGLSHEMCTDHRGAPFDCSSTPVPVTPLDDLTDGVVQLVLGSRHTCALTDAGTVYCWGDNALGQLGQGDLPSGMPDLRASNEPILVPDLTGVVQLAAGGSHNCALLDTGSILCWGAHDEGQLGDGQPVTGGHHTCRFGSNDYDCSATPVPVSIIDDATAIGSGTDHVCAVRGTDQVWCWGVGDRLQLGHGSRERALEPVRVAGIGP